MGNLFLRMKYRLRLWLSNYPWLFFAIYGTFSRNKHNLINEKTQIVIEGFPRSSNSFALWAFLQTNPDVYIAHHSHSQAQIIKAVEKKLPLLVVIREPTEAIRSLIIRHPYITPHLALSSYMAIYNIVKRHIGELVLASIEEVSKDFGRVEARINRKFSTHFNELEHTDEATKIIFDKIDAANKAAYGQLRISYLPRPHSSKDQLKQKVNLDNIANDLPKAVELYKYLLTHRQD